MNVWKCKCGKRTYWGSGMTPQDCEGCEECDTNYNKEPLIPHDFSMTKYNQHTGKSYKMCARCFKVDEESYKESKIKNSMEKMKFNKKVTSFSFNNNSISILRPKQGYLSENGRFIVICEDEMGFVGLEILTIKQIGNKYKFNKEELKGLI